MPAQGIGGTLQTRVYLEGILVENAVRNITVAAFTGQPATCQLELVPTNTIRHIFPGTWVHIFVTDPWELNPAGDLGDFKLLFEGVVINRGFTRTDDARHFVVQCADPSVYWTSARQQWLNLTSAHGGFMDQISYATSGGEGYFGSITGKPAFGYLGAEIKKIEDNKEETFLDTLIAILDDIGNVNPFYTNARNRFRITDRILRGRAGDTEKLFQMTLMSDFLTGLANDVGGQSNLAEVVNTLLQVIMHEWIPIVAPPYIESEIFERDAFGNIKREEQEQTKKRKRKRNKKKLYRYRMANEKIVATTMFKPHIYTVSPPTFNTLFPNMYDQASFQENFMAEPTRISMTPNIPLVGPKISKVVKFMRPSELEIFQSLIRDPDRQTSLRRTADGKFGDGAAQASSFTDLDWTTNEERIRGVVYNYLNLAPAPSTLTLKGQGKKEADGKRKNGVPKYLNNVASYEYFRSKMGARSSQVSGPFNMRPVVGFPMLVLDDSEAKLNILGYLSGIQHVINASGQASTTYSVELPRIVGEVDHNCPKFDVKFDRENRLRLDLIRDEEGNYDFSKLFDAFNQPPIPEWFDESFRNVVDLGETYAEWFGPNASVVQSVFKDWPRNDKLSGQAAKDIEEVTGINVEGFTVGEAARAYAQSNQSIDLTDGSPINEFEETLEQSEKVSVEDATDELNRQFAKSRRDSKEFEQASKFTNRQFTRIDEAFRFIGASSKEFSDKEAGEDTTTLRKRGRPPTFEQNPAETRSIDYSAVKLEVFVGDVSAGSGYAGVPIEAGSGDLMTGAFPVFDTELHTGEAATDAKTRTALLEDPAQRAKSSRPRYEGRPLMYDFEYRLWLQSRFNAKQTPTGEELAENAAVADYFVVDGDNAVRPKTPEERAQATADRLSTVQERKKRDRKRKKRGRMSHEPSSFTCIPPNEQARTGDGLEQGQKLPLPQPLAEYQVVELRRAVAYAYREELVRTRGFTG